MKLSNFNDLISSSKTKRNYGPCLVCRKPIVYELCSYCSAKCNFLAFKAPPDVQLPGEMPEGTEPVLHTSGSEPYISYEPIRITAFKDLEAVSD